MITRPGAASVLYSARLFYFTILGFYSCILRWIEPTLHNIMTGSLSASFFFTVIEVTRHNVTRNLPHGELWEE